MDIEASVNSQSIVLLSEVVAIIELVSEANGLADDPRTVTDVAHLKTLVGASEREEFILLAEYIWTRIGLGPLSSLFLRHAFAETLKELKDSVGADGFDELYAESVILGAQEEHWISKQSVLIAKHHLKEHETLSLTLKRAIQRMGLEEVVEKISYDPVKLMHKVETLDMSMSELRLICLVLEITLSYEVKEYKEPSEPKPPRTDFPLAG